jgi:hypothetical protein
MNSGASIAGQSFWQAVAPESKLSSDQVTSIQFSEELTSIQYFDADEQGLRDFLALVPHELSGDDSYTILLPMPDGSQTRYSIVESPIMEAALVEKYPEIKSYLVNGIDDPGAFGRIDMSPKGFRGMIYTSLGRIFIDPDWQSPTIQRYLSHKSSGDADSSGFQCSANQLGSNRAYTPVHSMGAQNRIAGSLISYRLAVSATQEYVLAPNVNTNGAGNELSDALAEINTAINRVNVIYQRDLGIRLVLVANNDIIIDVDGTSDLVGFNDNGLAMLAVNQAWIDSEILSANYDIGHVFTTGGGGVASIRAVCDGSIKAQGVTGLPDPTGETFYIDFVAHEIGHQFGAEHSFNGTTGSCGSNRSMFATTFEPGSGSTIMAYAGLCGAENVQNTADATFHAGSILQINNFVAGAGNCNTEIPILPANADPVAIAGPGRTIPLGTSFQLQGSGTDSNPGDTLSYQWDQMDGAGTATSSTTLGDDFGDNALFRSYPPQPTGDRDFPALGTQVADGPIDLSEALPCSTRIVNFRLTVRDNKSGQATDDISLTVDGTSGPFRITSFNTAQTIFTTSPLIFNWNVANTNTGAVSCANVDVDLLTFSADHKTYAVTQLLSNVVNNGNQIITLPDNSSSNARFRVSCNSNIFYDISDADLIIQNSGGGGAGTFDTTGNTTFFNINGQVFATSSTCVAVPIATGGGGRIDGPWLLFLLSLSYSARWMRKARQRDIQG